MVWEKFMASLPTHHGIMPGERHIILVRDSGSFDAGSGKSLLGGE